MITNQVDRPQVGEINGLAGGRSYHEQFADAPTVSWKAKGLKVTRLRLISDPGFPFWDVSYCHGVIAGKPVVVRLPFNQLPKHNMKAAIVEHARVDGVYAKGIGLLNIINASAIS